MNECLRSHYYDEDEMHEECGVFGIYDFDGNDVANTIYYGLFALPVSYTHLTLPTIA